MSGLANPQLLMAILVATTIGGLAWVFLYPILSGERKAEKRRESVTQAEPVKRQARGTPKSRREQVEGGFAITAVHLTLKAKIPGTDQKTFEELANKAKDGCPVSKVLKADITLDTTLVS